MSATTHSTLPVLVRTARRAVADLTPQRYQLLPGPDCWSIVGPDGDLVVRTQGAASRRRCLQAARARGVLALF
ncbi:MAG: hypothetical protein WBQ18_03185 [Solirubrobacteraceae bacterium]